MTLHITEIILIHFNSFKILFLNELQNSYFFITNTALSLWQIKLLAFCFVTVLLFCKLLPLYWVSLIILTQCPLNNGMAWQREASVVVPGLGPTLHSDYLWLQIPVAWLCWNQSLDTERAVGDEFRRGTGWTLFISCTQQRGRYFGVAKQLTGWGNREKRPFLYGNHRGQPLAFPAALLSSAGSLSKSHLNSER